MAGAGNLGLHSLAVANSATVLSGTALTVPGGLPSDAQLGQWSHMTAEGPSTLAVLPPTLTRPRPLEGLDTVPVCPCSAGWQPSKACCI